jgi:hypothetical protein
MLDLGEIVDPTSGALLPILSHPRLARASTNLPKSGRRFLNFGTIAEIHERVNYVTILDDVGVAGVVSTDHMFVSTGFEGLSV